jgi:hypothetical protein
MEIMTRKLKVSQGSSTPLLCKISYTAGGGYKMGEVCYCKNKNNEKHCNNCMEILC